MSKLVGPHRRVVSIDADELSFAMLRLNLEQNLVGNVTTLNCAFWVWIARMQREGQANSLCPDVLCNAQPTAVACRTIKAAISATTFVFLQLMAESSTLLRRRRMFLGQ